MVPDFVIEWGRHHGRKVRPLRAERAVSPLDRPQGSRLGQIALLSLRHAVLSMGRVNAIDIGSWDLQVQYCGPRLSICC